MIMMITRSFFCADENWPRYVTKFVSTTGRVMVGFTWAQEREVVPRAVSAVAGAVEAWGPPYKTWQLTRTASESRGRNVRTRAPRTCTAGS